ncbi:MATE family efflux transporter [Haloprofundus halophilus]|uniref:MATE family efflux transporter n=1 Tax=Haloprofundus halophilus TaxID=2283527 RepID=UPI000E43FB30|nr:MATE family efflux transporter [Haloprofundus halophilus]
MSLLDRIDSVFKGPEDVDLTSGGIVKPLFYLSLPIVLTNLMQTAYNLADTFWLGQYDTAALAAISFAFPMVFLLISIGTGFSVAGSVLVAQHTGANDEEKAEYAASQTVTFSLLAALVLGLVGFVFVEQLLSVFGASPEVLPMATSYMQVISLGLMFMFGFFVFVALMRGYGDTVTPMLVMFGSVVLNIFLDPFLIFGFDDNPLFAMLGAESLQTTLFAATGYTGSGITGAAVATIFSRALALAVGLAIMFNGTRGVEIHLRDMAPNFGYARKLLAIGLPASVEGSGRAISINLLLIVVGLFSTNVVAAYGVGTRVLSVIFLPALAVARGVETMTGQNIGANKPDRAEKAANSAALTMFVVLSALGVLTWFGARPIVGVFTDNQEVISIGAEFLRYVAPTFGFIGIVQSFVGSFRGAGKTVVAAVISVSMLGLVRLPVAFFGAADFGLGLGSSGIWLGFAVSNVVGGVIAILWYRRGTWRDVDISSDRSVPSVEAEPTDD